jgi:hypothetical protein
VIEEGGGGFGKKEGKQNLVPYFDGYKKNDKIRTVILLASLEI